MSNSRLKTAPRGLLALACLLAAGLAACGQSGPLYLPESQQQARPASTQPDDAQPQDDQDKEDGGTASGEANP